MKDSYKKILRIGIGTLVAGIAIYGIVRLTVDEAKDAYYWDGFRDGKEQQFRESQEIHKYLMEEKMRRIEIKNKDISKFLI